MKLFPRIFPIFVICVFLLCSVSESLAQTEDDLDCYFSADTASQTSLESIPVLQDTSLKIAILLVQFADWETNINARGSVGWFKSDSTDTSNYIIYNKYRYHHFWEMYFTRNTYIDDPNNPPTIHPDHESHGIRVYGSFRDYYHEVSHDQLDTQPAVTHPAESDSMFRSGIINRFRPDSSIVWVTLDSPLAHYPRSITSSQRLLNDAVAKAHALYLADSLDVDIADSTIIDRVFIYGAGNTHGGLASSINGRYSVWRERARVPTGQTSFLHGFGGFAHEFGHQIGFRDYYGSFGGGPKFSDGLGKFSLMGTGSAELHQFSPNHLDPWNKLQIGWLDYEIITNDTTGYTLLAVEDTSIAGLPKVGILPGRGQPGNGIWTGNDLEYFILENRSTLGFDLTLNFGDPSFGGGMMTWHYAGGTPSFANGYNIRVIEADADSANPDGDLSIPWGDDGSRSDFFPGDSAVTLINDYTLPGLRLKNGEFSHLALSGIEYANLNKMVTIDTLRTTAALMMITTNTTWSGAITLDRDVVVTNQALLSIEPGTIISVDVIDELEKITIRVTNGSRIEAAGTANSPIVLQSSSLNPASQDWTGFIFEDGSEGEFAYTSIRHAATAISGSFASSGKLEISHSDFESTTVLIENASIATSIETSEFRNNCLLFCQNSSIIIQQNHFLSGSTLNLVKDNSQIMNNILVGENDDHGIWIYSNNPSTSTITNNTISWYNSGIHILGSGQSPIIKNNILYHNAFTPALPGTVIYNNFWNNDSAAYQPPDTTNIEKDPKFINAAAGNFHLKANSPCIDRGNPADPYSNEPYPNGNRINMGAYGNTAEATLSFNIIAQNDLTANTTWSGYVNVMEDVSTNGYALTVQPGTKVLFDGGKVLAVSGDFICEGVQGGEPDTIIFRGYRPTERMGGVAVDYGDLQHDLRLRYAAFQQGEIGLFLQNVSSAEISFEHLEFSGNETGLYANESGVEIMASDFFNNETGLTAKGADLILVECEFDSNSTEGLYLLDSQFRVSNSAFRDNSLRGVYFEYSSEGGFYENIVTGNGYSAVNTQAKGGLVFYQSSPTLSGNRVTENKAPGMVSFASSYPLMVEPGYNLVAQNTREGSENPPEIQVYDISFPILDYGFNDIVDSVGGYLMHREGDEREIIVYVRENYWGTNDSLEIASRLYPPDSYHFSPFSRSWNTGGLGFAKGTGQGGNVLTEALQAERDSNYTAAMILYDSLANASPLLAESKAALERLYYLNLKTGEPLASVKACFDNLSSHPDTALATVAKRLAIRCRTYDEDYQAAINEHAAWAQTTPYFCDSVYSEIDILTNELFAGGGLFGKTTGSGRPGSNSGITSAQYLKAQQAQFAQYRQETTKLLNLLLEPGDRHTSPIIPQEFVLLQNYPNPFNPTTTIEYHLPFDSRVKIEIYNILGQRVKILVDQREKAGKYKIAWDGRNEFGNRAASGLYIYRIKAESPHKTFVTAKKMILLK